MNKFLLLCTLFVTHAVGLKMSTVVWDPPSQGIVFAENVTLQKSGFEPAKIKVFPAVDNTCGGEPVYTIELVKFPNNPGAAQPKAGFDFTQMLGDTCVTVKIYPELGAGAMKCHCSGNERMKCNMYRGNTCEGGSNILTGGLTADNVEKLDGDSWGGQQSFQVNWQPGQLFNSDILGRNGKCFRQRIFSGPGHTSMHNSWPLPAALPWGAYQMQHGQSGIWMDLNFKMFDSLSCKRVEPWTAEQRSGAYWNGEGSAVPADYSQPAS